MASIASEEDVVNLGLARIGHTKKIATLSSDTGNTAAVANTIYFNARDELMRAHEWNFLTKRVQLTDSGSDPTFGWDEGYLLPSDYLRTLAVHATDSLSDRPPYRIEKQDFASGTSTVAHDVILINSSTCFLIYIYKETTVSKWITSFQDAVAWELASQFALALPGSSTKFDLLNRKAQRALLIAKSIDGQEDYPKDYPEGSWVTDRDVTTWGGESQ